MKLFSTAALSPVMSLFLAGLLALLAFSSPAGTIVGTVNAEGKQAGGDGGGNDAYGSRKYKFVPKVDYAAMHDFVVYVEGPAGGTNAPATNILQVATKRVAQHSAIFSPHVLPVM